MGCQARNLPGMASLAGCVTFPISDALGRPVGIAGVIPDAASHGALTGLASLTVPATVGEAHEGKAPYVREALAGVHQARESIRKTGEAVVTLAPPQAASLQDMGATNAVSTLGGGLSARQATRLARLGAARVTLLFPRTAAGRLAARASLPAATQSGTDVMWVAPPEGGVRALRRQGMAALSAAVARAPWLVDAVVSECAEGTRLEDPDDLLDAIRATCATLRCAVGDVWQACACASSVARVFRVCRPETLYGTLLDGSPLGDSSWEERRDGRSGR